MNMLFEQKLCTKFDSRSKTFSFYKDQKKLISYIESNVPTGYVTVNWICYIPTFICNGSRVYRKINCDIHSWKNLIKYCYNNVLKIHICENRVQKDCKYSSMDSTKDWNHWMKNTKSFKKQWIPYFKTENRAETEKRCVEILLRNSSSRINRKIESFVKNNNKIKLEGKDDIFQIMSLIIFGEKDKYDLFRQFFSALWRTLSLASVSVFDDSILNDYKDATIDRYIIYMKKKCLTHNYQTRVWNDDKLKKMANEFKSSKETRLELQLLISNAFMDNTFPAGIDDLTLILNIYNFDILYLYSNINENYSCNTSIYQEGPCINCS